jgi:hypothetical protein
VSPMTHEAVFTRVAQKWANLVEACCPGVTRADWCVGPDEIVTKAWFMAPREEIGTRPPEMVEIVASFKTVDDYIHASEVAQFRADAKLVEFVIIHRLHTSSPRGPADLNAQTPEQWPITSARLGLQTYRPRWRPSRSRLIH